jgi:hypothetical protein
MYNIISKDSDITSTLRSLITGSLLSIPTLIKNPVYNIVFQSQLRFPKAVVKSILEQGVFGASMMINKFISSKSPIYLPTSNVLLGWKGYFKQGKVGGKRGLKNFMLGVTQPDFNSTTAYQSTLSPRQAVKDLELNSQRPHMEDNEFTRRIRSLENKLDKAMIKYNESQSIRKTYESILYRLNEERVGFDNQLSAIEKTLLAKQRDYEELLLLSGDANHAREVALNELETVRNHYENEKKKREKDLREKHMSVQLRKTMLDRMKHREKLRNSLNNTLSKPPSPEQELRNSLSQKSLQLEKIESKNKVNIFENAFRKIKEATGVSDVNEVIQKIITQESTTENLINVTKENQLKIETLNQMKKKIKSHVEELKYSGIGGGQHRKMVDSYEDQLANASTRLERARLKYERLNKIIISMKAGIGHLQDKLESFRDEIGGKSYIISDDSVSDALHECHLCFSMILKRIKAGEDEVRRINMTELDASFNAANNAAPSPISPLKATGAKAAKGPVFATQGFDLEESMEETISNINTIRPYNQRIDLNMDGENVYNVAENSNVRGGLLDNGIVGGLGVGAGSFRSFPTFSLQQNLRLQTAYGLHHAEICRFCKSSPLRGCPHIAHRFPSHIWPLDESVHRFRSQIV